MPTQHLKSPCCHALIRSYDERRRQCTNCLKTWRLSRHKRGRKLSRKNFNLVSRIVLEQQKISQQARYYPCLSVTAITKRFQQ